MFCILIGYMPINAGEGAICCTARFLSGLLREQLLLLQHKDSAARPLHFQIKADLAVSLYKVYLSFCATCAIRHSLDNPYRFGKCNKGHGLYHSFVKEPIQVWKAVARYTCPTGQTKNRPKPIETVQNRP